MIGLFSTRTIVDEVHPAEADALAGIHVAAFARSWSADEFAALIADRTIFALAARRQPVFGRRRLVGFALLRTVADEAEVLTIAVAPTEQGRGLGRQLMEEAMRHLYREGTAACFLEVDEGNAAAMRLYRSLGFEVVGRRKGYYRASLSGEGTALVMRVQLR
jgi:ribosomal-protein-alanine N-acetyltransferase